MGVYDELKARGLIAQTTNEEKIRDLLNNDKITFYIGFDPTADSLHVGHFVQIMVMAHMQRAGHVPIALFGGGTGMIGDPSGKDGHAQDAHARDDRPQHRLLPEADGPAHRFFGRQGHHGEQRRLAPEPELHRFLCAKWACISPSTACWPAECYKQRLERGLSFFELNYMLMQSYDFLELNHRYGCVMELGGDDQWSNIIGGVELLRRKEGKEVYGMTFTLLTTSEGKKMGKTEKGAVWLDPEKTSPFDFYQYWRNVDDADVIRCLKILTFLPLEEINELEKLEGGELNKAKEILAYEVTKLIHGEEEAKKAQEGARALFGKGANTDNMPSTAITEADFTDGEIGVLDLMVKTKLAPSRAEGRRLIEQGGVAVDDVKVPSISAKLSLEKDFEKKYVIIKKGKKVFHKVTLE